MKIVIRKRYGLWQAVLIVHGTGHTSPRAWAYADALTFEGMINVVAPRLWASRPGA